MARPGGLLLLGLVQLNPWYGNFDHPIALAHVDLKDGKILRTLDLPASTDSDFWYVLTGTTPDGIVLIHHTPAATEIVLLDEATGNRRLVTTLPAGSEVVPRGGVRRPTY